MQSGKTETEELFGGCFDKPSIAEFEASNIPDENFVSAIVSFDHKNRHYTVIHVHHPGHGGPYVKVRSKDVVIRDYTNLTLDLAQHLQGTRTPLPVEYDELSTTINLPGDNKMRQNDVARLLSFYGTKYSDVTIEEAWYDKMSNENVQNSSMRLRRRVKSV